MMVTRTMLQVMYLNTVAYLKLVILKAKTVGLQSRMLVFLPVQVNPVDGRSTVFQTEINLSTRHPHSPRWSAYQSFHS